MNVYRSARKGSACSIQPFTTVGPTYGSTTSSRAVAMVAPASVVSTMSKVDALAALANQRVASNPLAASFNLTIFWTAEAKTDLPTYCYLLIILSCAVKHSIWRQVPCPARRKVHPKFL